MRLVLDANSLHEVVMRPRLARHNHRQPPEPGRKGAMRLVVSHFCDGIWCMAYCCRASSELEVWADGVRLVLVDPLSSHPVLSVLPSQAPFYFVSSPPPSHDLDGWMDGRTKKRSSRVTHRGLGCNGMRRS